MNLFAWSALKQQKKTRQVFRGGSRTSESQDSQGFWVMMIWKKVKVLLSLVEDSTEDDSAPFIKVLELF